MVPEEDGSAKQPPEEIFEWYLKAACEGDIEAQFFVGYLYYTGDGVEQSYTEAYRWFCEAAMNGNPDAKVFKELMQQNGEGMPQPEQTLASYRDGGNYSRTECYSIDYRPWPIRVLEGLLWLILLPIRLILYLFICMYDLCKRDKRSRGPYGNINSGMSKAEILRMYEGYAEMLKGEVRR